jgi:hypothetical protein
MALRSFRSRRIMMGDHGFAETTAPKRNRHRKGSCDRNAGRQIKSWPSTEIHRSCRADNTARGFIRGLVD